MIVLHTVVAALRLEALGVNSDRAAALLAAVLPFRAAPRGSAAFLGALWWWCASPGSEGLPAGGVTLRCEVGPVGGASALSGVRVMAPACASGVACSTLPGVTAADGGAPGVPPAGVRNDTTALGPPPPPPPACKDGVESISVGALVSPRRLS